MEPLLEIKTIPISIEYKINKARYEMTQANASVEITRNKRDVQMQVKPLKLNIDKFNPTYPSGGKIDYKSDNGGDGIRKDYQAKATFEDKGNISLNINISKSPVSEILLEKFKSDISFNFNFIPITDDFPSWNPEDLKINYEIGKLNYDFKANNEKFKFIPGNIEFVIKEYPRLEINYTGKPIYVPKSADPDYVPIDTFA